jgi:hypothetical protein
LAPFWLALSLAACDQGDRAIDDARGPPLQVVATYPAAGQGLECGLDAPDDCGVPRNAVLQIRLDRYLLPASAVRQAIRFYSGSQDAHAPFTQPEYDLVERVLFYRPLGELQPKTTYTVELIIPDDEQAEGLRAFDGAPLAEGPVPLKFDFHTNGELAGPERYPEEDASCDDVIAIVGRSTTCSDASCHVRSGSPDCPEGHARDADGRCVGVPRQGLVLSDAFGLLTTAISKVAHQTELGSKTGVPLEDPVRMGVQMPIIDPARPDNSYLLYKLLRREQNFDADSSSFDVIDGVCDTRYDVGFPAGGPCAPPGAAESERLREWFVRGDPMPPTVVASSGLVLKHLYREELRTIQAWIRQGARCP